MFAYVWVGCEVSGEQWCLVSHTGSRKLVVFIAASLDNDGNVTRHEGSSLNIPCIFITKLF